jgi:hypothetical protein
LNIFENKYVDIMEEIPEINIVPTICPKVRRSPKFEDAK